MKELLVISGKGGTGKTTLVASFARLAERAVLADCDVDAADLHLLLKPKVLQEGAFYGGRKPQVDLERCTGCGRCTELCRFGAIEDGEVDLIECEGCGLCALGCPEEAISMQDHLSGHWYLSETAFGPMIHAQLEMGEENSGKLVAEVRKRAKELAEEKGEDLILVDGPPGVGCPVISSLSGVDMALVVTEPTVAALHDLERVLELCRRLRVEALVCINKFDVNLQKVHEVEDFCRQEGVEVLGKIPFDRRVIEALSEGKTPLEVPTGVGGEIEALWQRLSERLIGAEKGTAKGQEPLREGWTRRFVASEPRLSEMVKMYEEAGFEVRLEPLSAVEEPDEEGEECQRCRICFEGQEDKYRVIFTRPRRDPRPREEEP